MSLDVALAVLGTPTRKARKKTFGHESGLDSSCDPREKRAQTPAMNATVVHPIEGGNGDGRPKRAKRNSFVTDASPKRHSIITHEASPERDDFKNRKDLVYEKASRKLQDEAERSRPAFHSDVRLPFFLTRGLGVDKFFLSDTHWPSAAKIGLDPITGVV